MAIAAALASPYRFGRKRCAKRDAECLTQVGGLVEGAVPGLDEALRCRDIDRVPEAWSGIRRALGRGREGVPVNDYRRLAAEAFVVNECSGREDVRRRRRRGRIPTAAAAARLVQQNCGARLEFDDVVCLALSKWQRETQHHGHDEEHEQDHKPGITRHLIALPVADPRLTSPSRAKKGGGPKPTRLSTPDCPDHHNKRATRPHLTIFDSSQKSG